MPVFRWTMLATCLLVVLRVPVAGGRRWAAARGAPPARSPGRRPDRLPEPVLVLRAPGRVRDVLPLRRARRRGGLRASGRRFFGYHAFVVSLLGFTALSMSAWAHHMFTTGRGAEQAVRADLHGAGRARRRRVLRHHRHDVAGASASRPRCCSCSPSCCSSCRRPQRDLGRVAGARLPGPGLLRRRRALPLHAVRGQPVRVLRRRLPTGAQGHGPLPVRAARPGARALLVLGHEPDVPAAVRARAGRHGAPAGRLPAVDGLGGAEPRLDDRRVRDRASRSLVFAANALRTALQPRTAPADPWGTAHSLEWTTTSPPPPTTSTRCRPCAPTRRCGTCAIRQPTTGRRRRREERHPRPHRVGWRARRRRGPGRVPCSGWTPCPPLLLAGAGAAAAALGLAAGAAEHRRPHEAGDGEPEVVLTASAATTVATVGVAIATVGWAAGGPAYLWPGVGIAVAGLGGIVRERRAVRRLLERETRRLSRARAIALAGALAGGRHARRRRHAAGAHGPAPAAVARRGSAARARRAGPARARRPSARPGARARTDPARPRRAGARASRHGARAVRRRAGRRARAGRLRRGRAHAGAARARARPAVLVGRRPVGAGARRTAAAASHRTGRARRRPGRRDGGDGGARRRAGGHAAPLTPPTRTSPPSTWRAG